MFETLRDYRVIAWDMDDTLIGHPNSEAFWRFIRENPYNQTHHIVTMRSHGMEQRIFSDLEMFGSDLERHHFGEIVNIPNSLFEEFQRSSDIDPAHPFFTFKGRACARLDAEVLIDDMEAKGISKRGCDEHGIEHIHPDDL